jgi:hypothetical protein
MTTLLTSVAEAVRPREGRSPVVNTRLAIPGVGCDHGGKAGERQRPGGLLTGPTSGPLGLDRAAAPHAAMAAGLAGGLAEARAASSLTAALEVGLRAVGAAWTSADDFTPATTSDLSAADAWMPGESWRDGVLVRKTAAMPAIAQAARLWGSAALIAQDTYAVRETATFAHTLQAKASLRRHVRSRGPS